jgi:hypothetical protein
MDQSQIEKFQLALPPHLTATDKAVLLEQIKGFPSGDFFGFVNDDEPVQGDAWRGLVAINFHSAERDRVVGLVVSNSCDIARLNKPDPDQRVLFAPIIDLNAYSSLLREQGNSTDYVESQLHQIRKQEVHRIFYIPAMRDLYGESMVLLDDIHAQPLSTLTDLQRVFSLGTYGWYVLLMKLSVHFTRMADGVQRIGLCQGMRPRSSRFQT